MFGLSDIAASLLGGLGGSSSQAQAQMRAARLALLLQQQTQTANIFEQMRRQQRSEPEGDYIDVEFTVVDEHLAIAETKRIEDKT